MKRDTPRRRPPADGDAALQSSDPRQRLGRRGEAAAERQLVRLGMRVLARRFRCRQGEIDLVAALDQLLVFVEVKARRGHGFGRPAESVTRRKQRRIARVALVFLQRHRWMERRCRFDVVEVLVDRPEPEVRHIPDAFRLDRGH